MSPATDHEKSPVSRRLAAVVFADVVGFSRHMERDDVQTMGKWRALRESLLEPKIAEHGGHLLRIIGDGLFVEFRSAVNAVRWAHDVQQLMATTPGPRDEEALRLRIGINVEDVIVEEDDIHGDGVNIASRVQQLAGPGDVVVTAAVRDYIWNKLDVELTDLGEHQLKNISRPVRVFRVDPSTSERATRRAARPAVQVGSRPALAVLPFRNLGGQVEENYFGEGITEDIIGALSRNRSLTVIARHSTLPYRDRHSDARQVADELGVRYILDGSVRRQASKLRISVDLIDASQNRTIWADKYDGAVEELFDFQDRIAANTVATIEPRLYEAESQRIRAKPTESLDAYDCVLRAFPLFYTSKDSDFLQARVFLDRAIELDPSYAQAWGYKAWWTILLIGEWHSIATDSDAAMAEACAQRALALDSSDAFILAVAAHVESFLRKQPQRAVGMFERALQLNKNSTFAWSLSAVTYCYLGQPDEAMERLRVAWRLSPFDPLNFFYLGVAGFAEFIAGRYVDAIEWLERARGENPGHTACHRNLAACYALLGRIEDAKAAARDLLAREPDFRISTFAQRYVLQRPDDLQRLVTGLRAAGLPE